MEDLNPEAAEAIRIADKHLAGQPAKQRLALALDIQEAIVRLAGVVVRAVISEAVQKTPRPR